MYTHNVHAVQQQCPRCDSSRVITTLGSYDPKTGKRIEHGRRVWGVWFAVVALAGALLFYLVLPMLLGENYQISGPLPGGVILGSGAVAAFIAMLLTERKLLHASRIRFYQCEDCKQEWNIEER